MKPPRYLLRESIVRKIVDEQIVNSPFLEVGYGKGDMLITLSQQGLSGMGFDFSESAYQLCSQKLQENNISAISLVKKIPENQVFNSIFFFEVIGYIDNPVQWLKQLSRSLTDDGQLIFSFTNNKFCGDAELLSGNMACFDQKTITSILNEAGYSVQLCWNYGYPLSNWLRPLLHWFYRHKAKKAQLPTEKDEAVQQSGLVSEDKWIKSVSGWLGLFIVYPFTIIQRLFLKTDLGTGYVVVANKTNSEV